MATSAKLDFTGELITRSETRLSSLFGDRPVRAAALTEFARMGVPGRRSEEYKYVNMEAALKGDWSLDPSASANVAAVAAHHRIAGMFTLVLVNGELDRSLSDDVSTLSTVIVQTMKEASVTEVFRHHYATAADVKSDPFIAMNTVLASGGLLVQVPKNVTAEVPLHIINIISSDEPALVFPRNLVIVCDNAELEITETLVTTGSAARLFAAPLTEAFVAASARLKYHKLQLAGDSCRMVDTLQVKQAGGSVFTTNVFTLSGSLIRNNLNIVLDGEHIESHLNGLYLTDGAQVVDNHTLVDHRRPNCNSNELYKGIISGKSSATFNGKIFVRKDAQKTNAFQSNKNILLSDDGTINTKPQLEIYADDVKCSHGTSTGKLDEDKIFYLRARGLSADSAKRLLMHAFAAEVADMVSNEALREVVGDHISARFS